MNSMIYNNIEKETISKTIKNITKEEAIKDYIKLQKFNTDKLTNETRIGNKFVDYFTFTQRLETKGIKAITYFEFVSMTEYHDKPYIKRLLDYQKGEDNYIALYRIFKLHCGSIGMFGAVKAKEIINRFNPNTILDFCCGWGSSLTASACLNIPNYIGIDTNKSLVEPYNKMIDLLVHELKTTTKIKIFFEDAITVDYSKLDYDMVFTSPPYYNKEIYEYTKKRTNVEWEQDFYVPIFRETYKYLKNGGYYILNIPVMVYDNVCLQLLGEANIILERKKKSHPKNKQTNKDYKEYIYIWIKPLEI